MADPYVFAPSAVMGAYIAWREFLKPWFERREESASGAEGGGLKVLETQLREVQRRVSEMEEQLRHVPNVDAVATWMATTTETIRQLTAAVAEATGVVKGMTNARARD